MCGGNGWMWNGGYGGGGWGGWILTAIVLVVVFALVLTAIAAAVRYLASSGHPAFTGIGSGRSADDTLAPGRYEVLCNISGHYWAGMYAELDVTPNR